ncbi:Matrixin family protein [Aphelenchoides avenae]|nr:Matrixin family protein [Aphelenchus avenae]
MTEPRLALRHAFGVWSQVVPLNFTELPDADEEADIRVAFCTGSHGDGSPFDGPGGILAHATLPTDGMLHFDDSERWVYMDARKLRRGSTDLLSVGIHEIGHALGLPHFPVLPQLSKIDITAIQEIYGVRHNVPSQPTTTVSPTKSSYGDFFDRLWSKWFGGSGDGASITPRRRSRIRTTTVAPPEPTSEHAHEDGDTDGLEECPLSVDAIAHGVFGRTYVFDGTRVYELRGVKITKLHALQELFPGGPPIVKAALSDNGGRHMWLFHGFTVYEYRWNPLARRYRLDLESPEPMPEEIEFKPAGGMRWPNGRQLLFSCCGDIAVYDPLHNEVSAVGKLVESLPEFPYGVKGGFTVSDGRTVLLFTSSRIYKYDTQEKTRIGNAFLIRDVLECRHT